MKIFIPLGEDGYELCQPLADEDFETINLYIDGRAKKEIWKPIRMQLIKEEAGHKLRTSDSPWLGAHALIFRPRAAKHLESILSNSGELLPIFCQDDGLTIFNAKLVNDALDETASSIVRFKDRRIMHVGRYVFRLPAGREHHAFKISNLRVSPTFVSQDFVDLWTAMRLRGLAFRLVAEQ